MIEFDAAELDWQSQHKLLLGTVAPRPIALVTTLGEHGPNAAPFSFFNAVGVEPMMLMFSIGGTGRGEKDTLANIRECPEFVVHVVSEDIKDGMNVCAVDYPRGVDELAAAGFSALPSKRVRPPRIAEAPIALECKLVTMLALGRRPNHLIVGEVVYVHYREDVVNERFHVDVAKVNPIGRLAGSSGYTRITDRFEMPRIKYRAADRNDGG